LGQAASQLVVVVVVVGCSRDTQQKARHGSGSVSRACGCWGVGLLLGCSALLLFTKADGGNSSRWGQLHTGTHLVQVPWSDCTAPVVHGWHVNRSRLCREAALLLATTHLAARTHPPLPTTPRPPTPSSPPRMLSKKPCFSSCMAEGRATGSKAIHREMKPRSSSLGTRARPWGGMPWVDFGKGGGRGEEGEGAVQCS
jgi:hypothetical protein